MVRLIKNGGIPMSEAYKNAGVNIDAGNEAVERIKGHAQKTFRKEVMTGLGGFGSLFALENKYKKPILVSGTDGVGTKLKIAFAMNKYDTVGIDLVAMCVNDILVQGAEPLFFLDYIATGELKPNQIEEIIKGISDGCLQANCSLIGGETAEMPGMYQKGEFDLAGFAVGVVDQNKLIDGTNIEEGNLIIGLQSNGLHSNGFSLVRHLLFTENNYEVEEYLPELDSVLGLELLKPTRIYVKSILNLIKQIPVKGMAHITGGGFIDNIPRILPAGLEAEIELGSWEKSAIFDFLQKIGNLQTDDMYRTFNMGIGYLLIIEDKYKDRSIKLLENLGEKPYLIGRVKKGDNGVVLREGD